GWWRFWRSPRLSRSCSACSTSPAPPGRRPWDVPRVSGTRSPVTRRRCNLGKDIDRAAAGRPGHRARQREARRDARGVGGRLHDIHRRCRKRAVWCRAADRLVMIWAASTEVFLTSGPAHQTMEAFERAMEQNDPAIAPSMLYAYAALMENVPFANGAPNLTVDIPVLVRLAEERRLPIGGK